MLTSISIRVAPARATAVTMSTAMATSRRCRSNQEASEFTRSLRQDCARLQAELVLLVIPAAVQAEPAPVAPLLGEHTDEVLSEAGFDADTIAAMREDGAVR